MRAGELRCDRREQRRLRQLASHSDVQLVQLFDAVEAELPPPGRYRINVGRRMQTIDTGDEATRERYRAAFEQRRQALRTLARLPGVRFIACATDDDPALAFAATRSRFLVLSFTTDWRFPPERSREIANALVRAGKAVSYAEIDSEYGHDAFLIPIERYYQVFGAYMQSIDIQSIGV